MPTLMRAVKRLRDRWLLPTSGTVSFKDLDLRFKPVRDRSLRSLLAKMNMLADAAKPVGGSTKPYYRRYKPTPQVVSEFASDNTHIQLTKAHIEPYGEPNPVLAANRLFDKRAAAAISDAVGINFVHSNGSIEFGPKQWPNVEWKVVDVVLSFPLAFPFHG